MKYLSLTLLAVPIWLAGLLPFPTTSAPAAAPAEYGSEMGGQFLEEGLVVVELFTSQGCSSCPPADAVLQELAEDENVLALSFHVDYWNYLGWKDPFSSPWYSARQRDYTDQLSARTYTPQLVINGKKELVGSRKAEVKALVKKAQTEGLAHLPKMKVATGKEGQLSINYTLSSETEGLRVSALLVQPEAKSAVSRGENRGRDLRHVNVVRALAHQTARAAGTLRIDIPEGVDADEVYVVLLVQNTSDQSIVGAARAGLSAS